MLIPGTSMSLVHAHLYSPFTYKTQKVGGTPNKPGQHRSADINQQHEPRPDGRLPNKHKYTYTTHKYTPDFEETTRFIRNHLSKIIQAFIQIMKQKLRNWNIF